MEMIKKASAIRYAEIAELKKKIHILKEEILVLEGAE
jgi:ribosomal protein L29